jgi:hypothetical protein
VISHSRKLVLLTVITAVLIVGFLLLSHNCPSAGIAFTTNARALHRLKNRTALPQASDFNRQISLSELLKAGDDSARWSTQQAARIQAFVLDIAYARPEATNCYLPCRRDIHIVVANRSGAAKNGQVVLEVTPNFRDWAQQQGWDWSESSLKAQLLGHWCEFEGWMYFDVGHAKESENTASRNPGNWRATAWEIHPVTKFTVLSNVAEVNHVRNE